VEALTGGFALALFLRFGLSLSFFSFFAFVAAMVVITFIDLDHRIIPDVISLPGMAIGAMLATFGPTLKMKNPWSGPRCLPRVKQFLSPKPLALVYVIMLDGYRRGA
jgi:leader peptidase (prepilin peptidase)/N-methyltransferase